MKIKFVLIFCILIIISSVFVFSLSQRIGIDPAPIGVGVIKEKNFAQIQKDIAIKIKTHNLNCKMQEQTAKAQYLNITLKNISNTVYNEKILLQKETAITKQQKDKQIIDKINSQTVITTRDLQNKTTTTILDKLGKDTKGKILLPDIAIQTQSQTVETNYQDCLYTTFDKDKLKEIANE